MGIRDNFLKLAMRFSQDLAIGFTHLIQDHEE